MISKKKNAVQIFSRLWILYTQGVGFFFWLASDYCAYRKKNPPLLFSPYSWWRSELMMAARHFSWTLLTPSNLRPLTPNIDPFLRLIWAWFSFLSFTTRKFLFIFTRNKNTKKSKVGGGVFFWLASAQIGEKKPHPPGGFGEEPLYHFFAK